MVISTRRVFRSYTSRPSLPRIQSRTIEKGYEIGAKSTMKNTVKYRVWLPMLRPWLKILKLGLYDQFESDIQQYTWEKASKITKCYLPLKVFW